MAEKKKTSTSSSKKKSVTSTGSLEDFSVQRQSLLLRELELLLDLTPKTFSSNLLALPRELRVHIFKHVLPESVCSEQRPELHTPLWGADMVWEPWRHDIFGYDTTVPRHNRLRPELLLINRQLRNEILDMYFQRSKLTLHAELRNTRDNIYDFEYSPHILQLPMLKHVTHVRFYVEWNYVLTRNDRIKDQVRMTDNLIRAMDTLLQPLRAIENIELSVLFFWSHRSSKTYPLSMQDLFDLEDVFKRFAEQRWLLILRSKKSTATSPNPSAGVGYKLSSEKRGTGQSGGMEIFVSQDLEDAMRTRRQSSVDFYGNYAISDPLPQPSYKQGVMI